LESVGADDTAEEDLLGDLMGDEESKEEKAEKDESPKDETDEIELDFGDDDAISLDEVNRGLKESELNVVNKPIVKDNLREEQERIEKKEEKIQKIDDSSFQHDTIEFNEHDDFLVGDTQLRDQVMPIPSLEEKMKPVEDDLFKQIDDLAEENKYINVKPIEFPSLDEQIAGDNFDTNFFSNIPVKIDVMLGNTIISLKEVNDLTEGSIIDLDKLFGEPLELKISGQLVALGEVVAVDNNYGIMLKEIIKNKS